MPKRINVDWDLAKQLYIQGLPMPRISEKLGIKLGTLKNRGFREGWTRTLAKTEEVLLSEPVSLEERANRWRNRMVSICERKLEYLEKLDPSKFGPKDLLMMTQVERIVNENARVTMRMDAEDAKLGGPQHHGLVDLTLVKLCYEAQQQAQPSAPVIDIVEGFETRQLPPVA
jgi:hypothetical protein